MSDRYRGDHYAREIAGIRIDVYRILVLYGITHPCQQHAVKKLLRAGRGHKDLVDDVKDTIATLQRWLMMMDEEEHSW